MRDRKEACCACPFALFCLVNPPGQYPGGDIVVRIHCDKCFIACARALCTRASVRDTSQGEPFVLSYGRISVLVTDPIYPKTCPDVLKLPILGLGLLCFGCQEEANAPCVFA